MGLFEQLDNNVKISSGNNNDKTGRYWQRIDKIELATSRKKVEYVKISKTTIKVLDGENSVGEETTEAMFRDEYSFLERDLKRKAQAIYDLTTGEANELSNEQLKEMLIDSSDPVGEIVQVTVKELMTKGGKPFAKVYWDHRVSAATLDEGLDVEAKTQFFPEGVVV